jgi:hypothetical protein
MFMLRGSTSTSSAVTGDASRSSASAENSSPVKAGSRFNRTPTLFMPGK